MYYWSNEDTGRHEASRGIFATAELVVIWYTSAAGHYDLFHCMNTRSQNKLTREMGKKMIWTFLWNAKFISCPNTLIQAVSRGHDVIATVGDCFRISRLSQRPAVFRLAKDRWRRRQKKLASVMLRRRDQHHTTSILTQSALGFASLINQRQCNRRQMRRRTAADGANSDRF